MLTEKKNMERQLLAISKIMSEREKNTSHTENDFSGIKIVRENMNLEKHIVPLLAIFRSFFFFGSLLTK